MMRTSPTYTATWPEDGVELHTTARGCIATWWECNCDYYLYYHFGFGGDYYFVHYNVDRVELSVFQWVIEPSSFESVMATGIGAFVSFGDLVAVPEGAEVTAASGVKALGDGQYISAKMGTVKVDNNRVVMGGDRKLLREKSIVAVSFLRIIAAL